MTAKELLKEYGLKKHQGCEDMLTGIMEAHDITADEIADGTSGIEDFADYGRRYTPTDVIDFLLETNAHFTSWNEYVKFLIDGSGDTIEDFQDFLDWELKISDLYISSTGIVEKNIV